MDPATNTKMVPRCVGVIMDGNRRWARARNLPLLEGHRQGYKTFLDFVSCLESTGVSCAIVYAFSTENWRRADNEVSYLMRLFREAVQDKKEDLLRQNIRVRFVGDISRFPDDLQESMREAERDTASRINAPVLAVAVSYGGRAEIVAACNKARMSDDTPVTEDMFAKYLWTGDLPDPDLIIRTGGDRRLSNFLLWQAAYAELYFTDVYWPDFSTGEFQKALDFFAAAKRNFGA